MISKGFGDLPTERKVSVPEQICGESDYSKDRHDTHDDVQHRIVIIIGHGRADPFPEVQLSRIVDEIVERRRVVGDLDRVLALSGYGLVRVCETGPLLVVGGAFQYDRMIDV